MRKMMSGKDREELTRRLTETGVDIYDARFEMDEMMRAAKDELELEEFISRRIKGEPCAYIVGCRNFYKECYKVTPAVLIPRNDTEILVETAAAACGCNDLPTGKLADIPRIGIDGKVSLLDLCTGSGCVGISLANELIGHGLDVTAFLTDVSEAALEVAKENAASAGRVPGAFTVMKSDVRCGGLENLFDIITANPPYIDEKAMKELPEDVAEHEPELALAGGADGLEFYRLIVHNYINNVTNGGIIAVEHGYDLGAAVRSIFTGAGLKDVDTIDDYGGNPRVTYGFKR